MTHPTDTKKKVLRKHLLNSQYDKLRTHNSEKKIRKIACEKLEKINVEIAKLSKSNPVEPTDNHIDNYLNLIDERAKLENIIALSDYDRPYEMSEL